MSRPATVLSRPAAVLSRPAAVLSDPAEVLSDPAEVLRRALLDRVKLTVSAGLVLGLLAMAVSPAGGPSAALLDLALLVLALWLSRGATRAAAPGARAGSLSPHQMLLLFLALSGAVALVASGAGSRPLHGLAVAPFAMASFALSSHHARDLRSAVLASAASLLVLSVADDRGAVMALCALGLLPLTLSWITVRELLALDRYPELVPLLEEAGRRPWPVKVAVRLVVLTAVAALLLPSEPPPHLHRGGGLGQNQERSDLAGARGDAIGGSDGALDLRARGKLDDQPVLAVPVDTPLLWQGSYVDHYDGSGWTRTAGTGPPSPSYHALPSPVPMASGPGIISSQVLRLSVSATMMSSRSELVYAPGPVVGVTARSGDLYDLGTGSLSVHDAHDPSAPYWVAWRAPGTTVDGTVSQTRPPVSDPRWVALPVELPARVPELARTVTAAATSTAGKVTAVETYLRTHEAYQLDSPVPGEGKDAVDAFLFTDHTGFCEQFASAEAVLLRALGIPARVVTGYGGSGVATGAWRTYRNKDAHAWVQVGYAGQRWVDSDPTAGAQLAAPDARHAVLAWLRSLRHQLTGTAAARRWLALGIVVALALGWWLWRLVHRRWRRRPGQRSGAGAPGLATEAGRAYQRLLVRLAQQQRPRRSTETVRDLLQRLGAPQAETVAAVLESEWYGRDGAPPAESVHAAGVLDQLAAETSVPAVLTAAP